MTNEELADELAARLNALLEAEPGHAPPHVREAVSAVFRHRVPAHKSLATHPTIVAKEHEDGSVTVSALGILNGLIGPLVTRSEDGKFVDMRMPAAGLIAIETDGMSPMVQRFVRTKETP
jgi:hypothetical protein